MSVEALPTDQRIKELFKRQQESKAYKFEDAPDPRQAGKVTYPIGSRIQAVFAGLLHNCKTLRRLEAQRGFSAPMTCQMQPYDMTLHDIITRITEEYSGDKLVEQVKQMHRDKMLKGSDLSLNIIAIDGKNLGTLTYDGAGKAHHRRSPAGQKWNSTLESDGHYVAPVPHGVLVSAEQWPIIMQKSIPPGAGEAAVFEKFFDELDAADSKCGFINVISADAGLRSLKNADSVDERNAIYVFGLKGNQESLHQAAQLILGEKAKQTAPKARTLWETRGGGRIQRRLYTTIELQKFETSSGVWTHITQVWRVRQMVESSDDNSVVEDRLLITNIAAGRLKPREKLTLVRAQRRIENDAFNSLDMQWGEDSTPLCTIGAAM